MYENRLFNSTRIVSFSPPTEGQKEFHLPPHFMRDLIIECEYEELIANMNWIQMHNVCNYKIAQIHNILPDTNIWSFRTIIPEGSTITCFR